MDKPIIDPIQNIKQTMFWLSIGTLVYFFCQWLLSVFVVRITDYNTAGDFALIMASSNIFYSIGLFGMRPFQISDTRHQYSDKMYLFSRFITCGIASLACIIFCLFNDYTVTQKLCLLVFLVYRVTEAMMDVFHGTMQNASRMDIAGKSLIFRGILSLMLFCATLMLFKTLLLALLVMAVFSLIWLYVFEYRQAKKASTTGYSPAERIRFNELWTLLVSCLPLLIGNMVYALILFIPRYYVEGIYGTDTLGIYASISAPALVIPMFAQYIYTPYMPAISEHYLNRNKSSLISIIIKLSVAVAAIGVIMLIGGFFLGNWGLGLLFGPSIQPHTYMLMPIIVSVICTAFVYFLNAVIISFRRNQYLIISSAVAVVISISLSYLFVKQSINGASFVLTIVQAAQAIALMIGVMLTIKKIKKGP